MGKPLCPRRSIPLRIQLERSINYKLVKVRRNGLRVAESLLNSGWSAGTYVLRDDLLLGAIPAHPSDSPAPTINVLDTKSIPPTAGTRLSLAILNPRNPPPTPQNVFAAPNTYSTKESLSETSDANASSFSQLASGNLKAFMFGGENSADLKDQAKRKKPKSSITKSSSSFISRVIPHDVLAKRLQEHQPEGLFAFANISRAILWLDLTSQYKVWRVRGSFERVI